MGSTSSPAAARRAGLRTVMALFGALVLGTASLSTAGVANGVVIPPPPFPTNFKAVLLSYGADHMTGTIRVSWTGSSFFATYRVDAKPASGEPPASSGTCIPTPNTAWTCDIAGLTMGITYNIKITASNASGSSDMTFAQMFVAPPTAPTHLAVAVTGYQGGFATVELSWQYPLHAGGSHVTGYKAWVTGTSQSCQGTTLSCSFDGLTPGKTYTFSAQAVNIAGPGTTATRSYKIPAVPTQATPTPATPKPATPKPATPRPTITPSPSVAATPSPEASPSEAGTASPTPVASESPSSPPQSATSAASLPPVTPASSSGSGLDPMIFAITLLLLVVAIALGFAIGLGWRRRGPQAP